MPEDMIHVLIFLAFDSNIFHRLAQMLQAYRVGYRLCACLTEDKIYIRPK